MIIKDLIYYGQETLKSNNIEDYVSDTKVLLMYLLKMSYSDLIVNINKEVTAAQYDEFKSYIDLRLKRIPCQYITGFQNFMGYEFHTHPNVLIPRPETEILVENAIQCMKDFDSCKALDMCCGTGCIGIGFALERKNSQKMDDTYVLADISLDAINTSKCNGEKHNICVNVIQSDLFSEIDDKFDIIMSNPPYICSEEVDKLMPEVKDYEPRLALDGDFDGLKFYRLIINQAPKYLNDGGFMIFEIGYDQGESVSNILRDNGFIDIEVIKDYAGLDRVVISKYEDK